MVLLALSASAFALLALVFVSVAAVLALPDLSPARAALAVGGLHAVMAWILFGCFRRSWRDLRDRSIMRAGALAWHLVRSYLCPDKGHK
jgi:hypothetical protein